MSHYLFLLSYILILPLINFILIKYNFLLDDLSSSKHKNLTVSNRIPLSGGILFLSLVLFFFENLSFYVKIIFVLIYIVGFLSDINKMNSPTIRIILQAILLLILIINTGSYVDSIRIELIDYIFENYYLVKLFFILFCLLVFINGSNFIDGVNSLASGYFIIVLLSVIYVYSIKLDFNLDLDIKKLLIVMIIFIFYNLLSKSFLGDGGSYLISSLVGLYIINLYSISSYFISPYFIMLLLWYPAFENLFSIIRKILVSKKKPDQADTFHLHHLLITYIKSKLKFNNKKISLITSFSINIFNFIFFSIASQFIYSTKILLLMIMIMCFVYLIAYNFLLKIKKK